MNTFGLKRYLNMKNQKCNHAYIPVQGNSMEPLIQDGDCVEIGTNYTYDIGKIYVFICRHMIRVHRLLDIVNNMLVFKGDNAYETECIDRQMVLGIVEKLKRGNLIITIPNTFYDLNLVALSRLVNTNYLLKDQESTNDSCMRLQTILREKLLAIEFQDC